LLLWLLYLHHRLRLVHCFPVHSQLLVIRLAVRRRLAFLRLMHSHLTILAVLQLLTILSNVLVNKLLRVIHLGRVVHVRGIDAAQVRMLPLPMVTIKSGSKLDQTEYYR
jgi:hypothetical protein